MWIGLGPRKNGDGDTGRKDLRQRWKRPLDLIQSSSLSNDGYVAVDEGSDILVNIENVVLIRRCMADTVVDGKGHVGPASSIKRLKATVITYMVDSEDGLVGHKIA